MSIDAIIRVSFESSVYAIQAVNRALVGHSQNPTDGGPFEKVGTAVYMCTGASEQDVGASLAQLGTALQQYASTVDFVSISLVRRG